MNIEVVDIEPISHEKIQAIVTFKIRDIGKISGLKIVRGRRGLYCVPPSFSYRDKNGLTHWVTLLNFESSFWRKIQDLVLNEYENFKKVKGAMDGKEEKEKE